MQDPVRGEALVVAINSFDWTANLQGPTGRLKATLVVHADGVPKTTVEHSEVFSKMSSKKLERWPAQGDTIPVTVDRADPHRLRIEWNDIPSAEDRIKQEEQRRAKQLLDRAYQEHPRNEA